MIRGIRDHKTLGGHGFCIGPRALNCLSLSRWARWATCGLGATHGGVDAEVLHGWEGGRSAQEEGG